MNEHEIAKKITAYLDRGAVELKAGTAYKLQIARGKALHHLAEQHASELSFAGAGGNANFRGNRSTLGDARLWIGILLIVGSAIYYQYWQSVQQARDIEETDAAILTSDLPIEAYLDRGFQNWLLRSEP